MKGMLIDTSWMILRVYYNDELWDMFMDYSGFWVKKNSSERLYDYSSWMIWRVNCESEIVVGHLYGLYEIGAVSGYVHGLKVIRGDSS